MCAASSPPSTTTARPSSCSTATIRTPSSAPTARTASRLLWVTGETPADISGPADRAALAMGKIGISPPAGGSVFRIVEFPPVGPEVDKLDNDHLHHQIGGDAPKRGLPPRHPYMHRTRTIDYAIVMDGEIDMLLDDTRST